MDRIGDAWRQYVAPLLPGLGRTALLALACNLLLELSRLPGVEGYPWRFKSPWFAAMFLLGSVVIWLLVGLVHSVVGRFRVTVAIALVATSVVAFADHQKVRLRREPLYPDDWRFAGDPGLLASMVGPGAVAALVVGLVVAAAIWWVVSTSSTIARSTNGTRRSSNVWLRVGTALVCVLGLMNLSHFNSGHNSARETYEALGAEWRPWSQQRNYLGNGFVGGFLYNLEVPAMTPPPGYGPREIARIVTTYTRAAERINRDRDPHALDDVNVVMVLSESFSDPTRLAGVELDEDPIPFTRRLMRHTTSGTMLAQNIGGGTANMEFEALTGMSLSQFPPQVRVPYQMLVAEQRRFPSAVRLMERTGHRTVAIHPFTTEMYRRRDVYRSFGFDDFVYDERMHRQQRIGHDGYLSDASAFEEVRRRIDGSEAALFANLVTMQNHIPYSGRYDDPADVTGPDGRRLAETGHYVRGLSHTDDALRDLVSGLRRSPEKTLVVFYGDHLPGTYPDSVFEANGPRTMRETPFFIWSNFGSPVAAPPVTSPVHFLDLALEQAGAAVPPYLALLTQLRQEVPAMDSGIRLNADGLPVTDADLSERAVRLLHDYRLVQFDLASGRGYAEAALLGTSSGAGSSPDA